MTRKVVIDEDILGWDEEHHEMLKPYHTIIKVGDLLLECPFELQCIDSLNVHV